MSIIKHRILAVDNMRCAGCEDTIRDSLLGMEGVQEVSADAGHGKVDVTYDLMQAQFDNIEDKLAEIGHPVHSDLIGRIRHRILHVTEKNERDNLTAPPSPCCGDRIGNQE